MLESDSEHHCWEQPKVTDRKYILPVDCYVKKTCTSSVTPNMR